MARKRNCRRCEAPLPEFEVGGVGGAGIHLATSEAQEARIDEECGFDGVEWFCRYLNAFPCLACGAAELVLVDAGLLLEREPETLPQSNQSCEICSGPCRGPLEITCDGMGHLLAHLADQYGAPLVGWLCPRCDRMRLTLYSDDSEARVELRRRFGDAGPCPTCRSGRLRQTHLDAPHAGHVAILDNSDPRTQREIAGLLASVCDACGTVATFVKTSPGDKPGQVAGLSYVPEFVDEALERALLEVVDRQPWQTELKRRVQHYGYRYDYKGRKAGAAQYLGPLPDWLLPLCQKLVDHGSMPRLPDQVIVNEYQPGQGISAHVDCVPCFDSVIASLSLGSSCTMEFTHSNTREKTQLFLERRSLVVLSGDARYAWKHAIPARKSDVQRGETAPRGRRVSLTFRNVLLRAAD